MAIVNEGLNSQSKDSLQLSPEASGDVYCKIVKHLLVIIHVIEPVRDSKAFLLVLKVELIVRIDVSEVIKLVVLNVHSEVVFIDHVVIINNKIQISVGLFVISTHYASYSFILHEGNSVPPIVGNYSC